MEERIGVVKFTKLAFSGRWQDFVLKSWRFSIEILASGTMRC
jgi:hypothetical protein